MFAPLITGDSNYNQIITDKGLDVRHAPLQEIQSLLDVVGGDHGVENDFEDVDFLDAGCDFDGVVVGEDAVVLEGVEVFALDSFGEHKLVFDIHNKIV